MIGGAATPVKKITLADLGKYSLLGGSILRVVFVTENQVSGVEGGLPVPVLVVNELLSEPFIGGRGIEGGEPLPMIERPITNGIAGLTAIPVYAVGGTITPPTPPDYEPSLDFSDERNSMYLGAF